MSNYLCRSCSAFWICIWMDRAIAVIVRCGNAYLLRQKNKYRFFFFIWFISYLGEPWKETIEIEAEENRQKSQGYQTQLTFVKRKKKKTKGKHFSFGRKWKVTFSLSIISVFDQHLLLVIHSDSFLWRNHFHIFSFLL